MPHPTTPDPVVPVPAPLTHEPVQTTGDGAPDPADPSVTLLPMTAADRLAIALGTSTPPDSGGDGD